MCVFLKSITVCCLVGTCATAGNCRTLQLTPGWRLTPAAPSVRGSLNPHVDTPVCCCATLVHMHTHTRATVRVSYQIIDNNVCVPGPCPPCPKMVSVSCLCGKAKPLPRRCSNKVTLQRNNVTFVSLFCFNFQCVMCVSPDVVVSAEVWPLVTLQTAHVHSALSHRCTRHSPLSVGPQCLSVTFVYIRHSFISFVCECVCACVGQSVLPVPGSAFRSVYVAVRRRSVRAPALVGTVSRYSDHVTDVLLRFFEEHTQK